jgi:hypothetical protein
VDTAWTGGRWRWSEVESVERSEAENEDRETAAARNEDRVLVLVLASVGVAAWRMAT